MIEVVCGPMFSGKTTEMIRRVQRAKIAKLPTVVLKPVIDIRSGPDETTTHDFKRINAKPVKSADLESVRALIGNATVVGIDEIQFFSRSMLDVISVLSSEGIRIIVSGLDMDSTGVEFANTAILCARAVKVDKLTAICVKCGKDATMSFRLHPSEEVVMVGGKESYEARCYVCWRNAEA